MWCLTFMGENEEWTANSFLLNNIPGLRSSARLNTWKYLAILKLSKVISRIIYFPHYTLRTKFALPKRCKKEYNFIWRFYILFILHFIYFTIYLFEWFVLYMIFDPKQNEFVCIVGAYKWVLCRVLKWSDITKKQRGSYHCSCHHNTSRE